MMGEIASITQKKEDETKKEQPATSSGGSLQEVANEVSSSEVKNEGEKTQEKTGSGGTSFDARENVIVKEATHMPTPVDIVTEATINPQNHELVSMKPSLMREHYLDDGFGENITTKKPMSGLVYAVNLRPLNSDRSPFKENPPTLEDCQPITSYKKAMQHENSYVYSFYIPGNCKSIDENYTKTQLTGATTISHIPALTILKNNLMGNPTQPAEWPMYMSPNPSYTASYLHAIQERFSSTGALDMRFMMTASKDFKPKERYLMGRVWIPLTTMNIRWGFHAGNYDAAAPELAPAFASLETINLDTKKEITNIVTMFKFIDPTPIEVNRDLTDMIRAVANTKNSLSRLYWRIWCSILESSFAEHNNRSWRIRNISMEESPVPLNNAAQLVRLVRDAKRGIQPFFVSEFMESTLTGVPLKDLLYFLLSTNFQSDSTFALTKNWPPIGKVRLVLPNDHGDFQSCCSRLTVESRHLYDLLDFFSKSLGQAQLIDEIGRTVMMFALRPEGDRAWLGHRFINMTLPMFRSVRTLHWAWPIIEKDRPYPMKYMPYYKMAWVGSIRYMMASLAANTVFNELGVYSALQLSANGVNLPDEWYNELDTRFKYRNRYSQLAYDIQEVGLRCDWGSVLNIITATIRLMRPKLANFTRMPQWYEWMLFQRMIPEGTWLAGQMGHIKPKRFLQPRVSYNPMLCEIESGINDVYYRIATQKCAKINLHVFSRALGVHMQRGAITLSNVAGLPLDGQFRSIRVGDDTITAYEFYIETIADSEHMIYEWTERTKYHWQIYTPQRFAHASAGIRDGEIIIESTIGMPGREEMDLMRKTGVSRYDPVQLCGQRDYTGEQVLQFGNPRDNAESSNAESSEEVNDKKKKRNRRNNSPSLSSSSSEPSDIEDSDGIDKEEIETQKFPFHYCQSEQNPTVGERILKKGIAIKYTNGGVSQLAPRHLETMATTFEPFTELIPYVAVEDNANWRYLDGRRFERITTQGENRIEAFQDMMAGGRGPRLTEREWEQRMKAHEDVENARKRRQERDRLLLLEKEQLRRSQRKVHVGIDIKKHKDNLRGWAVTQKADITSVESDPFWTCFDGMENVPATASGRDMALKNRYGDILRLLDTRDLLTLLRGIPGILRGEFCRVVANMMDECTPYLPPGNTAFNTHKKIKGFMATAANNLSTCCALTEEELRRDLQNPNLKFDEWDKVGILAESEYSALIYSMLTAVIPDTVEASPTVEIERSPTPDHKSTPHTPKSGGSRTPKNSTPPKTTPRQHSPSRSYKDPPFPRIENFHELNWGEECEREEREEEERIEREAAERAKKNNQHTTGTVEATLAKIEKSMISQTEPDMQQDFPSDQHTSPAQSPQHSPHSQEANTSIKKDTPQVQTGSEEQSSGEEERKTVGKLTLISKKSSRKSKNSNTFTATDASHVPETAEFVKSQKP
uniref:Uncharacterized protein n=1 Tax=Nanning Totiv tick virus 4 TaxID=2972359 RepID=A0A9E8AAC3_9VIRU|nr:MAG: hypothetical protein [Nanning Totiv tick virus 4]